MMGIGVWHIDISAFLGLSLCYVIYRSKEFEYQESTLTGARYPTLSPPPLFPQ